MIEQAAQMLRYGFGIHDVAVVLGIKYWTLATKLPDDMEPYRRIARKYATRQQRQWMRSEVQFVRDNLHLTDREIGDRLGRSENSVTGIRSRQGISRDGALERRLRRIMWGCANINEVEARKSEYKADGVGLGKRPPNGGGQVRSPSDSGPLQRRRKVLAKHGEARTEALHD